MIFSMLHSSESDANYSKSTKYSSKLVKDFLDEPLEKNIDSEVSRTLTSYHHMKTVFVELFNIRIPFSSVLKTFYISYKDVLHLKGLSNTHFQMYVFFK